MGYRGVEYRGVGYSVGYRGVGYRSVGYSRAPSAQHEHIHAHVVLGFNMLKLFVSFLTAADTSRSSGVVDSASLSAICIGPLGSSFSSAARRVPRKVWYTPRESSGTSRRSATQCLPSSKGSGSGLDERLVSISSGTPS